jgi:hypothetical protein
MENKRVVVDTFDVDDKPLKLVVMRPTNKINQEANMVYNLRMSELIRKGSESNTSRLLLRAELEDHLNKMGVWTVKDTLEVEKLALEIRAHELMLKKGGIKISEGRSIAIDMAAKRQSIMEKYAKRQQFDSTTIESQAENSRFEFLLVKCLIHQDTSIPFLKNHNEYTERQDETAVIDGAKVLANMIYGLETNMHNTMFEMKWLKDAKMIDDEGRYISPDGTFTDRSGRLVNKDGRYVNEDGQMVDTFGRLCDEHGNLLVDVSQPFIDDETGESVIVGEIGAKTQADKKKAKKTATPKKRKKKTAVKTKS